MEKRIFILAGATGSGKTKLVQLFDSKKFEVISFDSRQIYKELAIGTAKPTFKDTENITHHLVDIISPAKSFTVRDYCNLAYKSLNIIWKKNKIPLITVGTAFYLKAFLFGTFENSKSSKEIKFRIDNLDIKEKIQILKRLDPSYLNKISENDIYRVNRAIEVLLSGIRPSYLSPRNGLLQLGNVDISGFFIDIEREFLYKNINQRVLQMVENGIIEETESVLNKYGYSCPALKAIGYSYVIDFLNSKISKLQLVDLIAKSHRNYAKKQITWFRNTFGFLLKKLPSKDIITQINQI